MPSSNLTHLSCAALFHPDVQSSYGQLDTQMDNPDLLMVQNAARSWMADEARILRVSVSSFLDHLALVLETMEAFGPPPVSGLK
ncbi:LAGE3 protein, partial [Polypterus senegalus]